MERINLGYWKEDEIRLLMPEGFVERECGEDVLMALDSGKIVLLYGPRQSGKTSLLGWIIHRLLERGVSPRNINYACMDYLDLHSLISDTRRLVRRLLEEGRGGKVYLFIDEVQRLEHAGLVLKQIHDTRRGICVVASGSSIPMMRDRIKEYLTGRKIEFVLYPFSFIEFLKARNSLPSERIRMYDSDEIEELAGLYGETLESLWREFVEVGGYPETLFSTIRKEWIFSGLFSSYIDKDVGSLVRAGNYSKFQEFVKLLASSVGTIYNREKVAGILKRDRRTIEKFEEILIYTFVAFKLTPFYTNIRKELRKNPRFYFVDTGLRNYLAGEKKNVELIGGVLENAIIGEMWKRKNGKGVYWWRTKGGAEVDLVLKEKEVIVPFEIKGIWSRKLTRSFLSFINTYSPPVAYFLTMNRVGKERIGETIVYYLPVWSAGILTSPIPFS